MKIELAKTEIIHFIGIGGIGMSGLALIMKGMGFKIQGSDISFSKNIERLKKNKIKVIIGHQKKNIEKATILVISSAIKNTNQELIALKEKKIPIVIHCRDAFDEVFEILEVEKDSSLFGIFHCFTGNLEQAKKAISYNMKLGIGGVVTFKNGKIDKFLNRIDLKHIVLESDAPYLSPTPYRGKRNETAYIVNVVAKLAEIYEVSENEIAAITTQNSIEVFGV